MTDIVQACVAAMRSGKSQDDVIRLLHANGATIIESMKTIMELYELPLGEAKQLVSSNPVWYEVVKAAEPLHSEVAQRAGGTGRPE